MKSRNSNIELVRYLSAVGILLGHSAYKGQGIACSEGVYNLFFHTIGSFADMGSMLLAMISFYFMWNSEFSSKRILKIWFQTFFYYSVITVFLLTFGKIGVDRNTIQYFWPVCGRPYWFVTAWIVFALGRPLFDYLLKIINDYKNMCVYTVVAFCVIPFCFKNSILDDEMTLFIALYCLTVYLISIRSKFTIKNVNICIAIYIISTLSMGIGDFLLQKRFGLEYNGIIELTSSCSPLMIGGGGAIFILLLSLPDKSTSFFNVLGSTSLGIYLFHCHPLIKNDLFWSCFNLDEYINSKAIIIVLFVIVLIVSVCCFVMNFIEKKLFDLIIRVSVIDNAIFFIDEKYKKLLGKLV